MENQGMSTVGFRVRECNLFFGKGRCENRINQAACPAGIERDDYEKNKKPPLSLEKKRRCVGRKSVSLSSD